MRHLTKNHHPTQITLILLPGRVCLWIVGKAWVCKVDAFLFKTRDQNCSRIHESLAVCERATAATMYCSHYVTKDSQSFANGCSPENDAPSPRKSSFYLQTIHFQLEIFCSRSLKNLKKNMSLSFHFCSYGKGCILLIQNDLYVSKSKVWKWFRFPKRSREELVPKSVSFASKQNSSKVFEEKNVKTSSLFLTSTDPFRLKRKFHDVGNKHQRCWLSTMGICKKIDEIHPL